MRWRVDLETNTASVEEDLEDEGGERWRAEARLASAGQRLVIAELRISPADPQKPLLRGLEARLLRRVPIRDFLLYAQALMSGAAEPGPATQLFRGILQRVIFPGFATRPRPRRRVGRDDRFFAELAAAYIAHARRSRSPVKDLAKLRRETPARIRDQLHEARVRGLLSEGDRGRPGGMLLPYGLALLKKSRATRKEKVPHRK